jgi:hypothetical protein
VFELFVLDLNESIELACADSSEAAEPMANDHGVSAHQGALSARLGALYSGEFRNRVAV